MVIIIFPFISSQSDANIFKIHFLEFDKLSYHHSIMSIGNIEDRIKKMKQAIKSEAKQRAQHIVQIAMHEAAKESADIIKNQKDKIQTEFQRQLKQEQLKGKIEKSTFINRQRIRKMESRHQLVQQLQKELFENLVELVENEQQYKKFLKEVIIQGMLRLMQRKVYVQARSDQIDIIRTILPECQRQFQVIVKNETGRDMESKLQISEYYLQEKYKNIIGGVLMRSSDGSIVCDNSLNARVELIFQHLLPVIRQLLFPKQTSAEVLI